MLLRYALVGLLAYSSLTGCGDDPTNITVRLRTDLAARNSSSLGDFDEVYISAGTLDVVRLERTVDAEGDYLSPQTVTEFPSEDSPTLVAVELRADGELVVRRMVMVVTSGLSNVSVTVNITRDCVGVTCEEDESCFAGECETVCDPSVDECEADECEDESDCDAGDAGECGQWQCWSGECVLAGDDDECDGEQVCLEGGCVDRGSECDAGGACGDDPCNIELIVCEDGQASCERMGQRPTGAECGAGLRCDSDGECVDADEVCVAGDVCEHSDPCLSGRLECDGDEALCGEGPPLPASTPCGDGLACDGEGECVDAASVECEAGAECVAEDEPCRAGVVMCDGDVPVCSGGDPLAEGTSCGEARECDGEGRCESACSPGGACDSGDPCVIGMLECDGGEAVCVSAGPQPMGTVCEGGTCDGSGECSGPAGCVAGLSCVPPNVCMRGLTWCAATGDQECVEVGPAPVTTPCGDGDTCNGEGECGDDAPPPDPPPGPCMSGVSCVPSAACSRGLTWCDGDGNAECVVAGPAPSGSACEWGTCDFGGNCLATMAPVVPLASAGVPSGAHSFRELAVGDDLAVARYFSFDGEETLVYLRDGASLTYSGVKINGIGDAHEGRVVLSGWRGNTDFKVLERSGDTVVELFSGSHPPGVGGTFVEIAGRYAFLDSGGATGIQWMVGNADGTGFAVGDSFLMPNVTQGSDLATSGAVLRMGTQLALLEPGGTEIVDRVLGTPSQIGSTVGSQTIVWIGGRVLRIRSLPNASDSVMLTAIPGVQRFGADAKVIAALLSNGTVQVATVDALDRVTPLGQISFPETPYDLSVYDGIVWVTLPNGLYAVPIAD